MAGGGGGKSDMERIGLFSEMGYTTIGDKYPKVHLTSCKYCIFCIIDYNYDIVMFSKILNVT